jgi:hypothetical protein
MSVGADEAPADELPSGGVRRKSDVVLWRRSWRATSYERVVPGGVAAAARLPNHAHGDGALTFTVGGASRHRASRPLPSHSRCLQGFPDAKGVHDGVGMWEHGHAETVRARLEATCHPFGKLFGHYGHERRFVFSISRDRGY